MVESPPVLFADYDADKHALHRLVSQGQHEFRSGSLVVKGPAFGDVHGFTYAAYDRHALLLHGGHGQTARRAAVATVVIPEDRDYRVVGEFDGKGGENVRIFLDGDFQDTLLDEPLSGKVPFDISRHFLRGQALHFAVMGGKGEDAFVQLRFRVDDHHTATSIPEDLP